MLLTCRKGSERQRVTEQAKHGNCLALAAHRHEGYRTSPRSSLVVTRRGSGGRSREVFFGSVLKMRETSLAPTV